LDAQFGYFRACCLRSVRVSGYVPPVLAL
jgi:hypothetical protein